jgi:aminopeptidase N
VPYPWAKYDQVCVNDFTAGGMENTSLTILSDRTLHTPASEELRESRGLVAHELAHQWFGDLVTCKDWSHLWLNEGFATYYTHLFEGHKDGRDEMLYGLYQSAKGIVAQANDTNAIVRRDFNSPNDQFGFHAYPKGSWILHMLRNQLGDDLYRRCVKTYLERHQYGSVVTEDLNRVIEELSGRSFDQFFDQYVYHAHHPELGITYSWDDRAKLAKLSVSQNQRLSDDVLLFNVPLTVRFKGKFGTVDRQLNIQQKAEDFYLPLPGPPEIVRIDPDVALLARISFNPPTPMLFAQLSDKSDAIGRLLAAEQLNGKREALGRLKDALNEDSFYPVRLAASGSLRAIQSEGALQVLLASTKQKDARVRRQVANDIAGFYRPEAFTNAVRVLAEEKNFEIRAANLSRLAGWSRPEVKEQILAGLKAETFHNVVEEAAITAARGQDDPVYIGPIMEMLKEKEKERDATSTLTTRALDAMAWLARNEEKKDAVRECLLAQVNSPRQRVRVAALNGLGTLRDYRATPVLEKFASGSKTSPERSAAERSLTALRETAKPSAELGNLRSEVLTLQRENRELRKEMDDLKKKFEALSPKATADSKDKTSKESEEPKPTKPAARPFKR